MAKKFIGNITLASAINQSGAQPLDDRVVVNSKSDLYNSFGNAIYEGMMVVVNAEHAIYVLTDTTKVATAAGWKKIGDVSGEINALQNQLDIVETNCRSNKTAIDKLNGAESAAGSVKNTAKSYADAALAAVPVKGVKDGDNVISLGTDGKLSSTVAFSVDDTPDASGKRYLKLTGIDGANLGKVDIADFVKDGMLEGAALYEATAATGKVDINGKKYDLAGLTAGKTYIVLVWNTGSGKNPMTIDAQSLIDVYTAGTGLTLTGKEFSITGGTVDSQITNRLGALKSSLSDTSNEVTVEVTQTDGKLTGVTVTAPDTALIRDTLTDVVGGFYSLTNKKLKGIADGDDQEIPLGGIPEAGLDMSGNNTLLAAKGTTLPDEPTAYSSPVATDTVTQAILKVDKGVAEAKAAASSAASSGVTKFAEQTGAIKIDGTGAGSYPVKLSMDATTKTLKAAVSGLGTAAAKSVGDFATKAQGDKADNSVQYNDNGVDVRISGSFTADTLAASATQSSGDLYTIGVVPGWLETVQFNQVQGPNSNRLVLNVNPSGNYVTFDCLHTDGSGISTAPVIINGIATPTEDGSAANKKYVDDRVSAGVSSAMTWTIFE